MTDGNDKLLKTSRSLAPNVPTPALDLPGFRALVLVALIASVLLTWPLWTVRALPPLLPLLGLPQVSLGVPLIAACLTALRAPRLGAILVSGLLAYGMAVDQTRMQPEFISLPVLLWGSLPSSGARLVARAHLISLWFFAGLHKSLSPAFISDMGPGLFRSLRVPPPEAVIVLAPAAIIVMELGTACLATLPRTRWLAAWTAISLHVGTVLVLAAQETPWNTAVWPWNLVLATSGFALIAPWRSTLWASIASARSAPAVIAVLLILAPATSYVGLLDDYPAHHLYSAATAKATIYCPAGCAAGEDFSASWALLNVPLPPEPRLFQESFRLSCRPGDVLRIDDPHPAPWIVGAARLVMRCPSGSLTPSHQ